MIQKLRRKFIAVNMLFVSVILITLFSVVLLTTGNSLRRDSYLALEHSLTLSGNSLVLQPPEFHTAPQQALPGSGTVALPCLIVQVTQNNYVYILTNQFFDTSDEEALRSVIAAALSDKASGDYHGNGYHLRYLRASGVSGTRIAFVDLSQERSTIQALSRNLSVIGLGTLGVFFLLSILLSRWAVRPVEQSWKQQQQFVADASHELKTPLTVILSSVDMLQDYQDADEEKRLRWQDNIRYASRQMQTLVEQLLLLARSDNASQPMEPVRLNLSELVEEQTLVFDPIAFEQGKSIDTELADESPVQGDPALLRRIVDIYLDNACKYADPGSVIQVSVAENGRHIQLAVHTKGTPLTKEQLHRIFTRFYRVDDSRTQEGYGLGLSIASELANLHRGKVWAEAALDGNTFFLSLPKA